MSATLSISEAARLLGVHPDTLRRWANKGLVPYVRTPGKQRRFYKQDIDKILKGN